jgi:uncharacterized protein (DUF362 family)
MGTSTARNKSLDNVVFIKRCEEYDRDTIMELVREGMTQLNYAPSGKVFVKPNVVFASKGGRYGSTTWTHSTVVGASLLALSQYEGVTRVDLGENTAVGFPTRMCMKYAGYYDEIRQIRKQARAPIRAFCIDEERRERVFVGGVVHDTLRVARKMARADTKVYLPKLKCHCVSTMTGAVKLNIGICSDDERSIRHDFLLNEKIVDLLAVGYPDFIIMDAIDVGVGNEAVPTPRRLGLLIMGRNPIAVDLVGARLLGQNLEDVPYLKRAVERGYTPTRLEDVVLGGDIISIEGLDNQARRILPYDDEFYRWQDVEKELKRLKSPLRFFWGYTREEDKSKCLTGCVMGLKMFLGFLERYAGSEAFGKAKPAVFVIGKVQEEIDAEGNDVFMIGSCSRASIVNAKKVTRIDRCFTTAGDMLQMMGAKLGIRSPLLDPSFALPLVYYMLSASVMKNVTRRYLQDMSHFIAKSLMKRL